MDYVSGKEPEDAYVRKLEQAVAEAKKNREWRHEYMTLLMRDQENLERGRREGRREGREEGRREGKEEGRREGKEEGRREGIGKGRAEQMVQGVANLMKSLSFSLEEACKALGIELAEYERAKNSL